MPQTEKEYTRLGGRGRTKRGFFIASRGIFTLWAGKDHLLLVERNGYTENYRRFYFTDIQAVIIRKTKFSIVLTLVMSILTLFFLAVALNVDNLPARISFWIIGGIMALFAIINQALGPSCETHIQTAVQREQIPSFCRLRPTRQAVAQLRSRLIETQGVMTKEEIKARWLAGIQSEAGGPSQTPL